MTARNPTKQQLLDAALPHVIFDGWSDACFCAAAADAGVDLQEARALCGRGPVDLAVAFHQAGDQKMLERLAEVDLSAMRYRDRVALAVRLRLEVVGDKDYARRGSSLFALPQHAAEGARLIWGTADAIWNVLGDTSDDVNWYSKRATLSAVYGATVLFWLGDESDGDAATWAFLERRIENVMQIEKLKAQVRKVPALDRLLDATLGRVRAPQTGPMQDVPGRWSGERTRTR